MPILVESQLKIFQKWLVCLTLSDGCNMNCVICDRAMLWFDVDYIFPIGCKIALHIVTLINNKWAASHSGVTVQ